MKRRKNRVQEIRSVEILAAHMHLLSRERQVFEIPLMSKRERVAEWTDRFLRYPSKQVLEISLKTKRERFAK